MSVLVVDLETCPLDEETILANMAPWDESEALSRKGNRTKPETINAFLEEDRANHVASVMEKAALSPSLSQIAIFGIWTPDGIEQFCLGDRVELSYEEMPGAVWFFDKESDLLAAAWKRLMPKSLSGAGPIITGWNLPFDTSFLVRRSWILGAPVPTALFNPQKPSYPWPHRFVCMMDLYRAGRKDEKFTSLSNALRALGLPPKNGDGKDFPSLWQNDRKAALAYSANDLVVEALVADRLGLIRTPEAGIPVMSRMDMEEVLP